MPCAKEDAPSFKLRSVPIQQQGVTNPCAVIKRLRLIMLFFSNALQKMVSFFGKMVSFFGENDGIFLLIDVFFILLLISCCIYFFLVLLSILICGIQEQSISTRTV